MIKKSDTVKKTLSKVTDMKTLKELYRVLKEEEELIIQEQKNKQIEEENQEFILDLKDLKDEAVIDLLFSNKDGLFTDHSFLYSKIDCLEEIIKNIRTKLNKEILILCGNL